MRNVLVSAAEAELAALLHNGQEVAVVRQTLLEMGHPRPPIPIKTENSTADGIANRSVIPHKTRSMDMRFYWVRDRVSQRMFPIYWKPGKEILQIMSLNITRQPTINVFVPTTLLFTLSPERCTKRGCVALCQTLLITNCRLDT